TDRARLSRRSAALTALVALALVFALAVMLFLRRGRDTRDARDEVVRRGEEALLERRRNAARVDRSDRLLLQRSRGRERAAAVTGVEPCRDRVARRRELRGERCRKLRQRRLSSARGVTARGTQRC